MGDGAGAGAGAGAPLNLALGSSTDPFPAVATWQGTGGQSEQESGPLAGALRVVHVNRAATEALQVQGAGQAQQQEQSGGGWRLWLEPPQVEHLRQVGGSLWQVGESCDDVKLVNLGPRGAWS